MRPENQARFDQAFRISTVLCAALAGSVVLYVGIAQILKATQPAPFHGFVPEFEPYEMMRVLMIGVTAVLIGIQGFLRRKVLANPALSAGKEGLDALLQRLSTAQILSFALIEAVATLGLLLFLLRGNEIDLFAFVFVALVLFAVHWPRKRAWEQWIRTESREPL